jgi:hypothetical protein
MGLMVLVVFNLSASTGFFSSSFLSLAYSIAFTNGPRLRWSDEGAALLPSYFVPRVVITLRTVSG